MNGQRYRLDELERWTKKKCQKIFICQLQRRKIVHEFVRRKLHGLLQGVRCKL